MKKLLGIVVLGLLWCNAGVAAIEKLERCYTTQAVGEDDYRLYNTIKKKFDELRFKENGFIIDRDRNTVKFYNSRNENYAFGIWFKPKDEGVVILRIGKDTPAKKAKLKKKDIILEFDGTPIKSHEDWDNFIFNYRSKTPGDPVEVKYKRKKKIKTKSIIPQFRPESSWSDIWKISYQDDVDIVANHVKYSKDNVLKINLKTGQITNENQYNDHDPINYFIKCEKTTFSAKKDESKKEEPENENISGASGTAFFIDNNGRLITNHHVIDGCKDKSQITYNNKKIKAKLIAKDQFLDLALLKADVKNNNFISISTVPPKKLKRVIVAGYPFGLELSNDLKFNSGIITSLKGLGDDSTRIQIDAAVNPGNSGGPIVYEDNGELAAVAVAGLSKDKTEAVNFGIKASSVKNFLQSNQIDLTFVKQNFNSGNDDLSELLESSTVYTFCK